ncbi:MAG TPA: DUF1269 domain-containing protein [Solirubrobacteraceae bacterium]|nr:DUF1269 domain-containing protein [Solirubrobacteraceae bacterium]
MSDREPDRLVSDGDGLYSVIAVSFEEDRNAYKALTILKELDSQRQVGVQEGVVVVRGEDGQVVEEDRIAPMFLPSTTGGGLVGLLIGIIGGPFGMLIGAAGGLLIGSLFDLQDIDETESALGSISSAVTVGRTALLAVVAERSAAVIDAAMSELEGTVLRRSVDDVEAETPPRSRPSAKPSAKPARAAPGAPGARQSRRRGEGRRAEGQARCRSRRRSKGREDA